ncbi:MAG: hypothetical protein E7364_04560 [Clostridiales bacterium]|nr:hypothetical protein [Clostridiales bacterium]
MKRKTLLSVFFAVLFAVCGLFGACGTNDNENSSDSTNQSEIVYTISADDISLLIGAEYKPDCSVKANGETVENATFAYRSFNTEVVSVSGEKLKAEKAGIANIAVSASVDGKQVAEATFSCKVNENKGIHPVKTSYLLYVSNNVKGVSFDTSTSLSAFVYDKGEIVTDAEIVWTVGDESIASVDADGHLQAVQVGETYLVGTYTDANNEELKTLPLPVKVEIPVLITRDDVIVDKAKEIQMLDAQAILGEDTIGFMFSASANKTYTINNNQMETASFKAGEHTCIFYNKEQSLGVQVNVVAADFVIYSKEDLLTLPTYSSGYIVLANDISDVEYVSGGSMKTFTGTFNGLGHTISNITYKYTKNKDNQTSWGLFYRVNAATIKNISIVGATLCAGSSGAFFYQTAGGETVIDNTYVEIQFASTSFQSGGAFGYAWRGTVSYSNSILIVNTPATGSNGLIAGRNNSQVTVKNSYVLGTGLLCGNHAKENSNYAVLNRTAGVAYATQVEFLMAVSKDKTDFSNFNKYWDLSQDIPCM